MVRERKDRGVAVEARGGFGVNHEKVSWALKDVTFAVPNSSNDKHEATAVSGRR